MATTYALPVSSCEYRSFRHERRSTSPSWHAHSNGEVNSETSHQNSHHHNNIDPHSTSDFLDRRPYTSTKDPSSMFGSKHRPRGESDLMARPTTRARAQSHSFLTSPVVVDVSQHGTLYREILTAILLPLPFLLSSLIDPLNITVDHSMHSTNAEIAEAVLEEAASLALPVPSRTVSLVQACALTSGTLILVGLFGRYRISMNTTDKRNTQVVIPKDLSLITRMFSWDTIRLSLLRMLCVGLPFLATVEIGGARTGVILLSTAAARLTFHGGKSASGANSASWRQRIIARKWTCMTFVCILAADLLWIAQNAEYSTVVRGYVALVKSVLFLQLPLPTSFPNSSRLTTTRSVSFSPPSTLSTTVWEQPLGLSKVARRPLISPLSSSPQDINMTIMAGTILGMITSFLSFVLSTTPVANSNSFLLYVASIGAAAAALSFTDPVALQSRLKLGLGCGLVMCLSFCFTFDFRTWTATAALGALCVLAYAAAQLDTRRSYHDLQNNDNHHGKHNHVKRSDVPGSEFTRFILRQTVDWPLIQSVFSESESRRIVYFMCINLGFMFIQTFYALVSGSLGLLSDSIHMFFDCIGLFAGLVAAVMSKWPPNSRFPYGFGKVETLSGLGNGIFLMIISVEIIWESFERFLEGAELKRLNELLVVSIGGLLVNLIGLVFIGHAHHGHGHVHGHDHDHSHGHSHGNEHAHSHGHNHDHNEVHSRTQNHAHSHAHHNHANSHSDMRSHSRHHELLTMTPTIHVSHAHSHSHHHGHTNENMAGIYLHILADTMGSVAVIASTLLTSYTGWSGWDPLASCIIAVLIIASSYSLVVGSAKRLLLTVPSEVEYVLRNTLQEISGLRGIAGYAVPRFWLHDADEEVHQHHGHDHVHGEKDERNNRDGQRILGVMHVIAARTSDLEDVRIRVQQFLAERNMDVVVHVEREGQGRCWCGGERSGGIANVAVR